MNMKIVGANIKKLRENVGLSQKNISDFLGIDQSFVSKIESGERSISSDMLEQLSTLFCYPVSKMLSEDQIIPTMSFAFRTNGLDDESLRAIAKINKIAINQLYMDELVGGVIID